jgi:protocatechuate 3,4-dioxygenase beta subunit
MKRRTFIKESSLTALSISAFGSIRWNGNKYVGDSVTTTDILGPFYRPGAPLRSNLIESGSTGIPLTLKGRIFKDDAVTTIRDSLVEIWHCDENEYYDNDSDAYRYRGAVKTNSRGEYEFKTIIPVPYKANPDNEESWRPAHIHMLVSVPGQQDLITQLYFKGGKYVEKDRWASAPEAVNRILEMSSNTAGESEVNFDVVMQKEFPLDEKVYQKMTGLYKMEDDNVEFVKVDDLLFMKWNGQLREGLRYVGNNSFVGGTGNLQVSFELLAGGGSKATVTLPNNKSFQGERFLKYGD